MFDPEEKLRYYLKRDTWDINTACYLLVGVIPEKWEPLGFLTWEGVLVGVSTREETADRAEDIQRMFCSNPDHGDRETPAYWIDWANKKGFSIPWKAFAKEKGLLPASRNEALQKAAIKLVEERKQNGQKTPSKREIANELATSHEWQHMTEITIERIIRKEW